MNDSEVDDLIILNGCGQMTKWRFPQNLTRCPVKRCVQKFQSRTTAINHYKHRHARNSAFCSICDGPFSAKDRSAFNRHYRDMHPNVKLPLKTTTKKIMPEAKKTAWPLTSRKKRCKLCHKTYSLGTLHQHIQKMHSTKIIMCPLKNCNYETTRIERLRLHWKSMHLKDVSLIDFYILCIEILLFIFISLPAKILFGHIEQLGNHLVGSCATAD